jgi:superfamily II DNA helicase RecQ
MIAESGAPEARKRAELARLQALVTYAEAKECRRVSLLSYFGETSEPCGACDICAGSAGVHAPVERTRTRKPAVAAAAVDRDDPCLVALKALRLTLARERQVPAYVVFPDATLVAMAAARPATKAALAAIPGVGEKKLAAFGDAFLATLAEFR